MRFVPVLNVWLMCLCIAAPVWAQQPESSSALQRVRVSLQNPPIQSKLTTPLWDEPGHTRIGILTMVPPQHRGEIVRVSLPVGDLVTRAVRGVAATTHRRAERKAREEAQRVIADQPGISLERRKVWSTARFEVIGVQRLPCRFRP